MQLLRGGVYTELLIIKSPLFLFLSYPLPAIPQATEHAGVEFFFGSHVGCGTGRYIHVGIVHIYIIICTV